MATVTESCGAGANVDYPVGDSAIWANPGNITSSDNSYATTSFTYGYATTNDYLKASNFGFSIGSGDTINGITVAIERKATNIITDVVVYILNGDGSAGIGSTNRSAGATWNTTEGVVNFGGSSDVWGATWTPAKVNSSNFGVVFRCAGGSTGFGDVDTAYVDHVEITINYTAGSSASSNPAFLMFVD